MQIKRLPTNVYRLYAYSRSQECLQVYREKYQDGVTKWQKLKKEGLNDSFCKEFTGFSRATYYRHKKILKNLEKGIIPPSKRPKKVNKPRWGEAEKQLVLRIRRENQTYGKAKIAVIIKRDFNANISESTVGRILNHLKTKGIITVSISASRHKRKRRFTKKHSKSWTFKKYENMKMGERIQIDHMTVTKNGVSMKHFQAWDRNSKYIYANVYSNAKSSSARKFLLELIEKCPFKIISIQVDGGSEFMAKFEQECENQAIPLIVLPPRMPKYNGGVERGNRIFREELYRKNNMLAGSIGAFRFELRKQLEKYNAYRPHFALKGLTPLQYINNNIIERENLSHII